MNLSPSHLNHRIDKEMNHSSWKYTFKTENNTSNNRVARGTKIDSSWSANGKEKYNYFYDCNKNKIYSP